jgi:hypothetical protein
MATKHEMRKVLRLAGRMDVADKNPDHLYNVGSANIDVWCTPENNPGGEWNDFADQITCGAYDKPAEYVGGASWDWSGDSIDVLQISTTPYFLGDHDNSKAIRDFCNRPLEIEWVRKQIETLFRLANIEMPKSVMIVSEF